MEFANEEAAKDGAQGEFALSKKWKTVLMCCSQAGNVVEIGWICDNKSGLCRTGKRRPASNLSND